DTVKGRCYESDGAVKVAERQYFDGRMHITEGYLYQGGRHAASGNLHDVGVGAGGFRYSGELHRDLLPFGGIGQEIEEGGVDICAPGEDRSLPQSHLAVMLPFHIGLVGTEIDLDT